MKLTDKQEKFVQELIKGKSQREAYKAAYNTKKMKDKTIDEKASRLFSNDKVRTRFNKIHDRLVKEAEDECIVSAKEVLRELKHTAFDDIKNYLSFRTGKALVGYDKDGQPIVDYTQIIEMKDSNDIDTRNISEVAMSPKDGFKFKLYDKQKALVDLGKHLGLFKDKVDINAMVGVQIIDDIGVDEDEED